MLNCTGTRVEVTRIFKNIERAKFFKIPYPYKWDAKNGLFTESSGFTKRSWKIPAFAVIMATAFQILYLFLKKEIVVFEIFLSLYFISVFCVTFGFIMFHCEHAPVFAQFLNKVIVAEETFLCGRTEGTEFYFKKIFLNIFEISHNFNFNIQKYSSGERNQSRG